MITTYILKYTTFSFQLYSAKCSICIKRSRTIDTRRPSWWNRGCNREQNFYSYLQTVDKVGNLFLTDVERNSKTNMLNTSKLIKYA